MKIKKYLFTGIFIALAIATPYAQEDDWGDEESDSSSSEKESVLKLSGDASLSGRYYVDKQHENAKDVPVYAIPELKLGLDYEGSSTNFNAKIKLNEDTLKNDQLEILDEFSANLFVSDWVFSAGKEKVVWGKGDKLHVLDNFNANDYTNFLVPDYLDRRIAEYMLRIQYNSPIGIRLEGIYTPLMTADRYAQSGVWVPNQVNSLTQVIQQVQATNILQAAGGALNKDSLAALQKANSITADSVYPNTQTLEYGQFGFYGNASIGAVDLGLSYYFGHCKQVSVDLMDYATSSKKLQLGMNVPLEMPKLTYDRLQVFGLDATTALGPFTFRGEFAYNMTNDIVGDDLAVRNNSISYLAGFDVGLPIHNLNINVQAIGNFILNADKIRDSEFEKLAADYDPTGCYTNNKIAVLLSDTFYYEKIKAEITGIYGFERMDLVLMPKITFKIRDGWEANLSGLYIANFSDKEENGEFYGWGNNSFVSLGAKYSF